MRTVEGQIVVPANAPNREARTVAVEVHDISVADAPSKMLAQTLLHNVQIQPGQPLRFAIKVPEVPRGMLAFRVHVDWDGDGSVSGGDLLTTQVIQVPAAGQQPAEGVKIPVTLI